MILLTREEANGKIKTYSYDNNGNRIGFSLAVNGENVIDTTYTYDALNRLATVTNNGETTTYAYDNNGNLISSQTGENAVTYEYNNANMLKSQTNNTLGVTYGATYYLNGNRRTLDETNKPQIVYTYDDYGKLVNEDASSYIINYIYDNRGNRIQKAKTELGLTETTTYSYDKNNKLLQEYMYYDGVEHVTDYTYDNNGNQIVTNYYTLSENEEESKVWD
ncbi:MAG: hypothetical protein E7391_00110 [Ruminococcaceae bacterium]|nr:hypothetical protein [Oscillospiraceae bacterium]